MTEKLGHAYTSAAKLSSCVATCLTAELQRIAKLGRRAGSIMAGEDWDGKVTSNQIMRLRLQKGMGSSPSEG